PKANIHQKHTTVRRTRRYNIDFWGLSPGRAAMTNILVVDDTAMERRRAGAILEKAGLLDGTPGAAGGVKVLYATHGNAALAPLHENRIDLVLTDVMMPEMNGLELVIETREQYPGIPVILMTAHGSEDIAAQALQLGAAGYVPKRNLARDL